MTTINRKRPYPLVCNGHTRPVVHVDFSEMCENSTYYLISASKDGQPMMRQGPRGDWVGTFKGHKGAIWNVALNKSATVAATGSADFSARLWNAVNGTEFYKFDHKHIVKSVHLSSNGKQLMTAGYEKLIRVFDVERPFTSPELYAGHESPIKRALFCRDDKCVVSIGSDKFIRIWDRFNGNEVRRLPLREEPTGMEILGNEDTLTVTHGQYVSFWRLDDVSKLHEYCLPVNPTCAALHPKKRFFACGGDDLKMYKFDYATGNIIDSSKGHFGAIHSVKFSPDGEIYASGSEDGTLRLWQTTGFKSLRHNKTSLCTKANKIFELVK